MTTTLTAPATDASTATDRRTRRSAGAGRRLPSGVALYLLASIVVSLLAGSSAPTPLYAIYQAEWGFSPITTTIVFGIYAIAVLSSLLVFGKLSDHVGRRPVLLVALAVQAAPWSCSRPPTGCRCWSPRASCRACRPAPRSPRSGPACSTSTGSRARWPTRSCRCSASAPAACCRACSCSTSPGRRTWSTWC